MKIDGTILYDENIDRFCIIQGDVGYKDLHCGDCFEVIINGDWQSTSIEYSIDRNEWYLVAVDEEYTYKFEGLRARI